MLDTLRRRYADKMLRPKKKTIADMKRQYERELRAAGLGCTQAKIAVSVRFGCSHRE